MAEFFARRIINGYTTFDKVPKVLQAAVSNILKAEGYEDHTSEGSE